MNSFRRALPSTQFAVGTAAVSVAAWLNIILTRWPGHERLEYGIFHRLFVFTDGWGAAVQVAIVLLVCAVPPIQRAGVRLAAAMGQRPVTTAVATFIVLSVGARFAYHAVPFSMDEYSQLAQAYSFAEGSLSWFVPVDLLDRMIPAGFRNYFLAVDGSTGRIASVYWPGYAALLTPFALAGVPWLLNPALCAVALLLIHDLGVRQLGTREAAGLAMLFALGSPTFTVNAISYYSMSAHLTLNLLFAWLLLSGRPLRAFIAGLVGGLALVLHNPIPHLLFAIPWLLWLSVDRRRWLSLLAVGAGYVPIGVFVGLAWPNFIAGIAGHVGALQSTASAGSLSQLFRSKISTAFGMPDYPAVLAHLNSTWKMWIWSVPGLLVLSFAGLRVATRPLQLLGASAIITYAVYWLTPFDQGHGWGYRYMQSAWAAFPLLAAAFVVSRDSIALDGDRWRGFSAGFALASLLLATTLRFDQVHEIIGEHVAQRISAPAAGHWVVFVTPRSGLYTWDMIQNLPGDSHQLTLMSFGGVADSTLMAARFPTARRLLSDGRGSLWDRPAQ